VRYQSGLQSRLFAQIKNEQKIDFHKKQMLDVGG
jgi:hypothetical protein